MNLLADQLGDVELTDDDVERLSDAATRAFTTVALATSLTVGLKREAGDGECPHYNVLTDAQALPGGCRKNPTEGAGASRRRAGRRAYSGREQRLVLIRG
ncbi:hypothetical protein ABZU75_41450 [Streptosporangium sp. NPDC005286]|uniref:hypothetical protein n=1 Tax=Streptosporangium sp. NPDC005286 TaxID=3154463 RepID=UPI0033BADC6C